MKTYDPKQVQVIVGGNALGGFADGTFVRVGYNANAFEMVVGADGEGTRAKQNDESGFFEITLMQSSLSNSVLSALALADRLANGGLVPVLIKDGSGTDLHLAEQAYIEKQADAPYGKAADTRVWMLKTDKLISFLGGNT